MMKNFGCSGIFNLSSLLIRKGFYMSSLNSLNCGKSLIGRNNCVKFFGSKKKSIFSKKIGKSIPGLNDGMTIDITNTNSDNDFKNSNKDEEISNLEKYIEYSY